MTISGYRQQAGNNSAEKGLWLREGERLRYVLSNQEVGVKRSADEERTVRPAPDREATAGLTENRVVFVVGDPPDQQGDFVKSLWYSDIASTAVESAALTNRWQFETTDGAVWTFTARETDTIDAETFLETVRRDPSGPHPVVRPLVDHCTVLGVHLKNEDWDAFEKRETAAWDALESAREECPDESQDTVSRVSRELHGLARERHVRVGRAEMVAAREHRDADEPTDCYRRAQSGHEHFRRVRELSQRADLDTEPAVTGLAGADDLADSSLRQLFAAARAHREDGAEVSDPEQRVSALESALDAYQTIAKLVSEGVMSEDALSRAQSEAKDVVAPLVEARVDAAADHRETGDWEGATGAGDRAREAYREALSDLDRALKLAESFAPGDADSIRERRAAVRADLESVSGARDSLE